MINIKLLKEICETAGAPGFENRVRSLVLKQIKNHVDHIEIDNMGNIIALKKGVDSSKSWSKGNNELIVFKMNRLQNNLELLSWKHKTKELFVSW